MSSDRLSAAPWLLPYLAVLDDLERLRPGGMRAVLTALSQPMPAADAEVLDHPLLNALADLACARGLVNHAGRPLRFEAAGAMPAVAYEHTIGIEGRIPTRTHGAGGVHDLANALAWLVFPRLKAALNHLQLEAAASRPRASAGGRRGWLRDRLTLFDESGVLFVTGDRRRVRALRRAHWYALFVSDRQCFERDVSVLVFGHGLIQRLATPFKGVCGRALWLPLAVPAECGTPDASEAPGLRAPAGAWVTRCDAFAQRSLIRACRADLQRRLARLVPLPVMGIPGWDRTNHSPDFYDDRAVFRRARAH